MNHMEKVLARGGHGPDIVRKAYVSSNGMELFEMDPDVIRDFLQIAQRGLHRASHVIGSGMTSFVYRLEKEDICVKLTSDYTKENRERARLGWGPLRPSLVAEAIYMHAVQKKLSRKDNSVHAPRQFAAVQTKNGSASLQERIPDGYKTIHELHRRGGYSYERLEQYGKGVVIHVKRVLTPSGLRFACADLGRPRGIVGINPNNILLNSGKLMLIGEVDLDAYVIDLIGPLKIQSAKAKLLGKAQPGIHN